MASSSSTTRIVWALGTGGCAAMAEGPRARAMRDVPAGGAPSVSGRLGHRGGSWPSLGVVTSAGGCDKGGTPARRSVPRTATGAPRTGIVTQLVTTNRSGYGSQGGCENGAHRPGGKFALNAEGAIGWARQLYVKKFRRQVKV